MFAKRLGRKFWHQQTDTLFFIFHVPCTVRFTVYFRTVTSVFRTSIYAVLYLQFYQIYASLQVLFKIFAHNCSVVIFKGIFEILRNSVSQKTF